MPHTRVRTIEKRVAAQLQVRSVEHLLPSILPCAGGRTAGCLSTFRFSGYVFVRLALRDRLRVLQIPSLVRLVGFGEQPYALADGEIALLRSSLTGSMKFAPHPYLRIGSRVRIARDRSGASREFWYERRMSSAWCFRSM